MVRDAVSEVTDPDAVSTAPVVRAINRLSVQQYRVPAEARAAFERLYGALTRMPGALAAHDDAVLDDAVATLARAVGVAEKTCRSPAEGRAPRVPAGAHKIRHVILVMQENRSFDHYFGTFPGAEGIPMRNGVPTACIPNPVISGCSRPHHSFSDYDHGGPHGYEDTVRDINGGKMDGFVRQWQATRVYCNSDPAHAAGPTCQAESHSPDVLSYHDAREIPNYWKYAARFVLQDHMFEPNMGWSQPAHLAWVSGWSAVCRNPFLAITCQPSIEFVDVDDAWPNQPSYGWADLTHLLHEYGVDWRYYVAPGSVDDCEGTDDEQITCNAGVEAIGSPEPWNPLPDFATVRNNRQVDNVQFHRKFFAAAREGTLPTVSWIVPGWNDSEHPPALVSDGQAWVTRLLNAVMRSPNWKSTAVFVAWDDWGGFYDHVVPPSLDKYSYGIRVPAFMVSPYARQGMVDHQVLSFDAYLKFIEDLFLDGARLDPFTDGHWDPRPRVVEDARVLGDLMKEFDFEQKPLEPMVLEPYPAD